VSVSVAVAVACWMLGWMAVMMLSVWCWMEGACWLPADADDARRVEESIQLESSQ